MNRHMATAGKHEGANGVNRTARAIGHGKGHARPKPGHQPAALGIEVDIESAAPNAVLLPDARKALAVVGHGYRRVAVVAGLLGRVEHWQDAREGPPGIPVEHVAGVGTHLVEAARQKPVKLYRTRPAPAVKPHLARLYHFARRVEQLYVEHTAHV